MPGTFVAFEGPDGGGKSTAIRVLKEFLESKGHKVLLTREPGGTMLGDRLRNVVLARSVEPMSQTTNALIFAAARRIHVENVIKPALEAGIIVLCDRFMLSTLCYQPDAYRLHDIIDIATEGLLPHITFYLDIEPAVGLNRLQSDREKDVFESERITYLIRRREIGLAWCKANPDLSVVVDASQPMNKVHADIMSTMDALLSVS